MPQFRKPPTGRARKTPRDRRDPHKADASRRPGLPREGRFQPSQRSGRGKPMLFPGRTGGR